MSETKNASEDERNGPGGEEALARVIPLVAVAVLVSGVGDILQIRNPWLLAATLLVRAGLVVAAPGIPGRSMLIPPRARSWARARYRRLAPGPSRYLVMVMAFDLLIRAIRPGLGETSAVASLMLYLMGMLRLPLSKPFSRWALALYAAGILAKTWLAAGHDTATRWYITAAVALISGHGLASVLFFRARAEAAPDGPAAPTGPTELAAPDKAAEEPGNADIARMMLSRVETLPLSAREKQVVGLLLIGRKRASISEELGISANTVKKHLANAYGKLGITSKEEMYDLVNGKNMY